MAELSNCPTCGAPLPAHREKGGVTCVFCGNFIALDRLNNDPTSGKSSVPEDAVRLPEPEAELPEVLREPAWTPPTEPIFQPEFSTPQKTTRNRPRWVTALIIAGVAICLSCVCLVVVLTQIRWENLNF